MKGNTNKRKNIECRYIKIKENKIPETAQTAESKTNRKQKRSRESNDKEVKSGEQRTR